MVIRVRIPTSIQNITQYRTEVEASGNNIKELIDDLDKQYHGIKEKIYVEQGKIRRFISIYINQEDIRTLQQFDTPLMEKDEVDIIVAIAGG